MDTLFPPQPERGGLQDGGLMIEKNKINVLVNDILYDNCRFIGFIDFMETIKKLKINSSLASKIITKETQSNDLIEDLLKTTGYKRLCFITNSKELLILGSSGAKVFTTQVSNSNTYYEEIEFESTSGEKICLKYNILD